MSGLRIEDYFHKVEKIIEKCPFIQLSNVTYEKRGTHEGFIHGNLDFIDSSTLDLREFVDVEIKTDQLMYVYQYFDSSKKFIFRYDNTGHHKKLRLPTHPHHKHDGSQNNVIPSNPPGLSAVLQEIERMVRFP